MATTGYTQEEYLQYVYGLSSHYQEEYFVPIKLGSTIYAGLYFSIGYEDLTAFREQCTTDSGFCTVADYAEANFDGMYLGMGHTVYIYDGGVDVDSETYMFCFEFDDTCWGTSSYVYGWQGFATGVTWTAPITSSNPDITATWASDYSASEDIYGFNYPALGYGNAETCYTDDCSDDGYYMWYLAVGQTDFAIGQSLEVWTGYYQYDLYYGDDEIADNVMYTITFTGAANLALAGGVAASAAILF